METLLSNLFPAGSRIILGLRDGTTIRGVVSGLTDEGLSVSDAEGNHTLLTPLTLSQASYLYTGISTLEEVFEAVKVVPNGKIVSFSGSSGLLEDSLRRRYQFRSDAFIDERLRKLAETSPESLRDRPILQVTRTDPNVLFKQYFILDASTLDDALDQIALLAGKGDFVVAELFCEELRKQFPDDQDVRHFLQEIQDVPRVDYYAPFDPYPEDFLPPLGRIARMPGAPSGFCIIDKASHMVLPFHERQLMGDLAEYYQQDEDLAGLPVVYSVKKWKGKLGYTYEARTIASPLSFQDAVNLAVRYRTRLPLNAMDLLRMVLARDKDHPAAKSLFDKWQPNFGIDQLWDPVSLAPSTETSKSYLVYFEDSLQLRRSGDHGSLIQTRITPDAPSIRFGDDPDFDGQASPVPEDVSAPDSPPVLPVQGSPEPKESSAPAEEIPPVIPDLTTDDDPYSLENCPDGDTWIAPFARAVFRYRNGTVYVHKEGVIRQYSFTLKELTDDALRDNAMKNQYTDKRYFNREVLCLLDEENEQASCICLPATVRELLKSALVHLNRALEMFHQPGDPEALAALGRALGFTEIVLKRIPGHPLASLLRSDILYNIQVLSDNGYKAPQGALRPTGIVSSIDANGEMKLTDAAYPRGIRLSPQHVVDRDYRKPRPGDELVYAVYPDNNGRVSPRFAHLARTPDELLTMADNWSLEGEVEKAWGIVMNILDAEPENEGALARKAEYESQTANDGSLVVSLSCRSRRNSPMREDLFASADRSRKQGHSHDAIRQYRAAMSAARDSEPAKIITCIRNIIELYSELYRSKPEDTSLLAEYRQFGNEYLQISGNNPASVRLVGTTPANLDIIIRFYEDVNDAPHLAEAYLQKKSLMMNPSPKQRLSSEEYQSAMAEVEANISWSFIRSGRIAEATQAMENALNRDEGNGLAMQCQAVLNAKQNAPRDGKQIRDRLSAFDQKDLSLGDNPFQLSDASATDSMVRERFRLLTLLQSSGGNKDVLLARYLATLLEPASDYAVAVARMGALPPECMVVRQLYGCIRKGLDWQGWADIQLACIVSVDAARSVFKGLYYMDSNFLRAWLLTFPFAEEGKRNATWTLAFSARMFQAWRQAQYDFYTDLVKSAGNPMDGLTDVADSLESIARTEQGRWMQRDDAEWMSSCRILSIRIGNYLKAVAPRSVHNAFAGVNALADQILGRVMSAPTVLSFKASYQLLVQLKEMIGEDFAGRQFEIPVPSARLVSASDVKADGGMMLIIAVETQNNAGSMDRCELSVVPSASVHFDRYNAVRTYSDVSRVYGGEALYFIVNIHVVQSVVERKETTLDLSFAYDVEGMERQSVPFSIDIPVSDVFSPYLNPYSNLGVKEENPNRFYGRDKDIKEVVDALSVPGAYPHYLIYGQKRSGKSSLLLQIRNHLDSRRFLSADIDFLSFTNVRCEEDIYYNLLIWFRKALQTKNRELRRIPGFPAEELLPVFKAPVPDETTFELLLDVFVELKRFMSESDYWKDCKIVLFIDEFTKAYDWWLQHFITGDFLQHWKSLHGQNLFCAVVVGQDTLPAFIEDTGNKNSFAVFESSLRVSFLPEVDARKMVTEPIIEVTGDSDVFIGDAVRLILKYSACSVYHTKWVCREIIKRMNLYELKKVTEADVEEAVREGIAFGAALDIEKLIDPLTSAGLDQNLPGRFTAEQAELVLNVIADAESRLPSLGCYRNNISVPNIDVAGLLADLRRRDVVYVQQDYWFIRVKLYLLWAKKKLHGSV